LKNLLSISRLLVALAFACSFVAGAQNQWSVTNTLHVGGPGGWDYVTTDPATHRLFITRGTHTQVLDEAGKVLADIPGQTRAHGVALATAANRGFITDGGGSGAIIIFDLTTYAVLGKLASVPDADGIIYDAALNRVLFVSGDANALFAFKADINLDGKIDPPIALGGSPEFLASDGSGKVFINLQDKDVVAAVDIATRKVVARWPVAPAGAPVGLSIDKEHHRLFIGCRKPAKLVVMSTEDGKILATLPIGTGVDATAFAHGQAFASSSDGTLTVIGERDGRFEVLQTIKTQQGARTLGLDPDSNKIFLPATLYEEGTPAGTRPKARPDSFVLVEVSTAK
jgi:DNA-binding beta-propeller fold protein YncE